MYKLLIVFCAALMFLVGCADPVVFSEVLQMKVGDKVYTACNIWYEDAGNIDCRNIQRGAFLPIGSEIIPVETTDFTQKIIFKDKKGKVYTIRFSEDYRLCSMSDYISSTFTVKPREEQLKGIPPKVRSRILRGEVVPGMNRDQVELAYGLPPAVRTPDKRNETWIYWRSGNRQVRVIFRDDVVRNVLSFNDEN